MTIRRILVPILQGCPFNAQLVAALQLTPGYNPYIDAVFISSSSSQSGTTEASISISDLVADDEITFEDVSSEESADEALARTRFKDWRAAHDLSSSHEGGTAGTPYAIWRRSQKPIENEIASSGRLSDVIVLNRPNAHETMKQKGFDAAVFGTGRPTLFVSDETPDNMLRHIVIAWNGSVEATRAVAAAMPLLERAERVSIFTVRGHSDPPSGGLDLSELLRCHDIQAHKLHVSPDEPSDGEALLKTAAYSGASMLVMGAYGHSRVREMLLDGVTLHVVRHGTMPVLMIH